MSLTTGASSSVPIMEIEERQSLEVVLCPPHLHYGMSAPVTLFIKEKKRHPHLHKKRKDVQRLRSLNVFQKTWVWFPSFLCGFWESLVVRLGSQRSLILRTISTHSSNSLKIIRVISIFGKKKKE